MDFTKYRRGDFEDTCLAIEKAIGDGEIVIEDYEPYIYPDDIDAVMKWVESQAEELHDIDDDQFIDEDGNLWRVYV